MIRQISMSVESIYARRAVQAALQSAAERDAIARCGTASTLDGFEDVLDERLEEQIK